MKIYLMRHGQTTGDIEERYGGDYDDHLTELGRQQVCDLAKKMIGRKMEKIFYSSKIRALETAEIIKEIINIPIVEVADLRERNAYGVLTSLTKKEAKVRFPELVEEVKNPKATIQGAEEYEKFKTRVLGVFGLLVQGQTENFGIITHGGVISCFLREVFRKERKRLEDCAVIELGYKNGKFELIGWDGVEF